eukprot:207866-Chlamydomonas_euryale.AAC.1
MGRRGGAGAECVDSVKHSSTWKCTARAPRQRHRSPHLPQGLGEHIAPPTLPTCPTNTPRPPG